MARARFPLFAKVLTWFFLNLAILAVVFGLLAKVQFRFGLDSLLAGRAGQRLEAIGSVVSGELLNRPEAEWGTVLNTLGKAYEMEFLLYRPDGWQVAGQPTTLPAEVTARMAERRGPGEGPGRGPPPGRGPRRGRDSSTSSPAFAKFVVRTENPVAYWSGQRLSLTEEEGQRAWPTVLVTRSATLSAGGLFIDLGAWAVAGFGAVVFSVLFWLPLIRSVTRSLQQMTEVTVRISQGEFNARADARRGDELGRLGAAINAMGTRLEGFVNGQKRFLGDVAHELCSPIGRIQVALGILETRADSKQRQYVEDVREEVQQMSSLVRELLSYSKAGLAAPEAELIPVNLRDACREAADREVPGDPRVRVSVDPQLEVMANPGLLSRALGNLLRNAVQHAATPGDILLTAAPADSVVRLSVADEGPGLPEELLQKVFDPFFRGDLSRNRESGGTGLGLAIVKTCVEACGGKVWAANRLPRGLEVTLELKRAQTRRDAA